LPSSYSKDGELIESIEMRGRKGRTLKGNIINFAPTKAVRGRVEVAPTGSFEAYIGESKPCTVGQQIAKVLVQASANSVSVFVL
jgi:hypothetical protein